MCSYQFSYTESPMTVNHMYSGKTKIHTRTCMCTLLQCKHVCLDNCLLVLFFLHPPQTDLHHYIYLINQISLCSKQIHIAKVNRLCGTTESLTGYCADTIAVLATA